ncbi:MAG: NTP transferase domain-containing protein [Ignavibacteria bacterium]|jgi:bifunctional UDP-N-acetylglucosamine pyrophosphorylase/glucosamine-1-phosphate N-acetyltransferase|nr:NTP transferase domain-containing protein [Ignavibacteria bacterium]MCU7502637.1 NTP transferase domain-containing protein [Ignavibacteria bacterium]MCU7515160.1 NTP transferase domain-containing protein [Ignavibacteria bacterium]
MELKQASGTVQEMVEKLSSKFNYDYKEVAIILAAGHGKRIKSQTSKMLHEIWGVPTVERVYNACRKALNGLNILLVVGIKAKDVMRVIGKRESTTFAFQEQQNGTGHAVQVALEKIVPEKYEGTVYVLPGDMGLIDAETIAMFRDEFRHSESDMMVLTGIYSGDPELNSYGRIIRVKRTDADGNTSGEDFGKVIEIIEHKDILHLNENKPYELYYNNKKYCYSKEELINNNEFNSGVYAFDYKKLITLVSKLSSNNVQKEIYITDLIDLFNKSGYSVNAVSPKQQYVLMGFNNKSVLREMEAVARENAYEKLKDVIEIADPDDFFIDESVIEDILEMDGKGIPLDIKIGKGVYIGKGVKLNYNLTLKKNAFVNCNVTFGKNVTVWENVHLSCFPHQTFIIGDNVEILWGDIIKGNIIIGDNSVIESSVNMTGSDEHPLIIGKNVLIKGTSYIFGSVVEDGIFIEHSVLIKKKVERLFKKDGSLQKVRFYLPMPEGADTIEDL